MSHVTRMNESCHTDEWVMSHMWMSCHKYEWVMSHIWMSHVTRMNESCQTHEWVMSHIWMSHVAHMNESCHTSKPNLSNWYITCNRSRKRSDLKYLGLQIGQFSCLLGVTGTPVYSRENFLEFLGNPVKTCLNVTGTQWKFVWNFGSRSYLKSDLLRPWMPRNGATHMNDSWHTYERAMPHM